tara:strand:+ start:1911 stop:2144 length:234 start_codon:yes stop_codon:yes gene_type:complete
MSFSTSFEKINVNKKNIIKVCFIYNSILLKKLVPLFFFWFRLDAKTICSPFGLNIGSPSNPLKKVILSRLEPSIFVE